MFSLAGSVVADGALDQLFRFLGASVWISAFATVVMGSLWPRTIPAWEQVLLVLVLADIPRYWLHQLHRLAPFLEQLRQPFREQQPR